MPYSHLEAELVCPWFAENDGICPPRGGL